MPVNPVTWPSAVRRARRAPAALRSTLALAILGAVVASACSPAVEAPASFDPASPQLTAKGIQFDTTALDVPAQSGFELVLHNEDGVQHNVSIYSDEGHSHRIFLGEFANTGTHVYHVQALAPGTYYFQCDIHPSMHGVMATAAG
ncbi:MAG TPA: cupredoxin domain-containing protein [Candidatus Limnocylindrales bacterium]|jgi:plastocyanin